VGWLYAAFVHYLESRCVVGSSMQTSMTSQPLADTPRMAVWRRGKLVTLLHRTDQVSQYTSEYIRELLVEQDSTCSTNRAGEVWDNSAMENLFSSLKTGRMAGKVCRTRVQARAGVFDCIERFCNPTRPHSTPGSGSLIAFENTHEALDTFY
jgi:putative transposase